MKTLNQLACMLVNAIPTIAFAQDAKPQPTVKIVNETKIFKLDDSRNISENSSTHSMCLSPDAQTLLYVQKIPPAAKPDGEAPKRASRGYRLVIRDIKTGKETVLPGAPSGSDDFMVACVSMRPFDAAGKNLIIPVDLGPVDQPTRIGKGQMQLGTYELATGKLTKLDVTGPVIFPSYDAAGKNIIVFVMAVGDKGPDMASSKIVISPVDKIKFKQIGVTGLPRSPCPAAGILPVLLRPNRDQGENRGSFVLYDTKGDKQIIRLPLQRGNKLDDYNPQWTADGRFLYYVDSETDASPDGTTRRKNITRIWDRKKAVEHAIIQDVLPIGPAPGKSAMILRYKDGSSKVHDPAANKTSPLLGDGTKLINANGRFILYIKSDKEGIKSVYRAEIK
jgi:hypothetical protein